MQFEPEPEDEWQAHCRNAVAMAEGETAPEEPVMAGEVVRVEAEAESELVVAGEVVPEIVEGAEGVATEPVVASETIERDAPAEGAAGESRGWLSLFGARREDDMDFGSGDDEDDEDYVSGDDASDDEEDDASDVVSRCSGDVALGLTRGSVEATGKWKTRPPSPAPADLYSGPRSDGLLSTDEISGEYSAAFTCAGEILPVICNSMTVVPHGPDAIETWRTGCFFIPLCGPCAGGDVRTRNPGTNAFGHRGITFSADGTASEGYKKRPGSQKRAFHKVETKDLAGNWCFCNCVPFVPFWPLSAFFWTTKKALNEDQYAESGLCCWLGLPFPFSQTRTRKYVNGHPTNGFDDGSGIAMWYRDPGCAGTGKECLIAKKLS